MTRDDVTSARSEPSPVVVLMGVSGAGKTTIGRALAARLGWSFVDGDDYHPAASVEKMGRGEPLDDADRGPWLRRLHGAIEAHRRKQVPLVMACSALKESYRRVLQGNVPSVTFVHLVGPAELIDARMRHRPGHYMPASLLSSQLETLELPAEAITIDVEGTVAQTVQRIVDALGVRSA